jgi:excisionase family DNA binding protein
MTISAVAPEPALITIEEAARYLRLSRAKTYQLAAVGDLPVVRVGRSVRVRADRLPAWLDERSSR